MTSNGTDGRSSPTITWSCGQPMTAATVLTVARLCVVCFAAPRRMFRAPEKLHAPHCSRSRRCEIPERISAVRRKFRKT